MHGARGDRVKDRETLSANRGEVASGAVNAKVAAVDARNDAPFTAYQREHTVGERRGRLITVLGRRCQTPRDLKQVCGWEIGANYAKVGGGR